MFRWRALAGILAFALLVVGCGSHAAANASQPSRATPLGSTLGWFNAIDAHDRRQLLSHVAPDARDQMGWARPSAAWAKFTDLHCRRLVDPNAAHPSSTSAHVRCTFHELGPLAVVGNRDNFWDVYLRRKSGAWLITSYGQG